MADYNDMRNMTLREELEARFKEAEDREKENEFLSQGWQPPAGSKQVSLKEIWEQIYGAAKDMRRNYFDMHRDNTKKADDYFHCKANYEAAARGEYGNALAMGLGNEKELFDYFRNSFTKGKEFAQKDYTHDVWVNKIGRQQAKSGLYTNSRDGCDIFRVEGINGRY